MKTPEEILKEINISPEALLSATDNGATLLEGYGKLCMIEGLKQGVINPNDCHKLIIELLAEEK